MLGIEDPGIYWAYILTILSSVLCVVYGIVNWNKGVIRQDDIKESVDWEEKEDKINENF